MRRRAVECTSIALSACVALSCGVVQSRPASAPAKVSPVPVALPTAAATAPPPALNPPLRLFAGADSTCALAGPGQVRCWGKVPVDFDKLARDVKAIDLELRGKGFACALDEARTAFCLGFSEWDPVAYFEPIRRVHRILPLQLASVAVLEDGSVCVLGEQAECVAVQFLNREGGPLSRTPDLRKAVWANGSVGFVDHTECKVSDAKARPLKLWCPRDLPVGRPALQLSAGDWSAFVDETGQIWREHEWHRRPTGGPAHERIDGFGNVIDVAVNYLQLCAHGERGATLCMPSRGVPSREALSEAPRAIPGLECTEQLVAGSQHHCALTCAGQILCWGNNQNKQLQGRAADGEAANSELPLVNVRRITADAMSESSPLEPAGTPQGAN